MIDLKKAPQLRCNYGRTLEISTLKKWIENQTQLITIYGLSGIGKTALTLKLIEEIKTEFDYIIYRSLDNIPQLIDIKDDFKQFFFTSQSNLLSDIIDYLRSYRCLIILDDLENIFKIGELSGQYLTEYKNYGKFFKQIATLSHQSCLILISWELPPDLEILEQDHQYTQILSLQGLGEDAKEILRHKDLKNQEMWNQLINLYQGHPSWLNIITSTILELFDGDVELFLEDQENNIYLGDLEPIIESHLQRLSASEKKLINWLASQNERVNIAQKPTNSELSKSEFLQAIKSLMRRGLVDKVPIDKRSHFKIHPIFKQYINHSNIGF
ncbi:NB-ARC domain-containing protein [Crocosphaera sp. XPORK-15E]|uniref:NB-ARC domain-containing protein n=1 Tax=Crocosphaera sp. XPORK-15E TaxID=3110247 RepID=UPI002B21B972|nr:NB-ARC domain-containing protein [Crocosphaera sp. XPORK-15E]MEA5535590.1 NB-ARC domain-containing protein [Crocosphaera sp. XPORK-15E]